MDDLPLTARRATCASPSALRQRSFVGQSSTKVGAETFTALGCGALASSLIFQADCESRPIPRLRQHHDHALVLLLCGRRLSLDLTA